MPDVVIQRLAIDPGVNIGMAMHVGDKYETYCTQEHEYMWRLLFGGPKWDVVIYEQFSAQLISKYGLHTVQLVGSIRAICYLRGIPVRVQTPQQRYPAMERAKALVQKLHKGDIVDHEVDAMAHLLAWEKVNARS